jgi:adenine-specific DNA-methyltransferase
MGLNPKRDDTLRAALGRLTKSDSFAREADAVVFSGPCELFLSQIPDLAVQLTVTSPPYNIGKSYERRVSLDCYLTAQARVISEVARVTADGGSVLLAGW